MQREEVEEIISLPRESGDRLTDGYDQEEDEDNYWIQEEELDEKLISCCLCYEHLKPESFPDHHVSPQCNHKLNTCCDCITKVINNQIRDNDRTRITFGYCTALIPSNTAKEYVTPEMFEK